MSFSDVKPIKAVPLRHPGRWLTVAAILVLAAMFANALVSNPLFQWDVVAQYFTAETILKGVVQTLYLTFVAMAVGIVLGGILAVMRLSPSSPVTLPLRALQSGFSSTR